MTVWTRPSIAAVPANTQISWLITSPSEIGFGDMSLGCRPPAAVPNLEGRAPDNRIGRIRIGDMYPVRVPDGRTGRATEKNGGR